MINFVNVFVPQTSAEGEKFCGRNDLVIRCSTFLSQSERQVLILRGEKKIGKTSLLKKIVEQAKNFGQKPVYFDLKHRSEHFLPQLLFDLMLQIDEHLGIEPTFSLADFEKNNEIFTHYLAEICKNEPSLLLIFDEFEIVSDKQKLKNQISFLTFVPYLAKLLEQCKILKCIFATKNVDENNFCEPLFKTSQIEEVVDLSQEDCNSLINKYCDGTIRFYSDAIKEVYQKTAGQPFFVQLLSFGLFEKTLENQTIAIRKDDVTKFFPYVLEKFTESVREIWNSYKIEEQAYLFVIATLTENNSQTNEKNIFESFKTFDLKDNFLPNGILENLLKTKHLESEFEEYRIRVPFLQQWIIKNISLENLRNELQKADKIVQKYLDLGISLIEEEEKYSEAIENFRQVIKRDPTNFTAQYNLAFALLHSSDNEKEIITEFEKAYQLNSQTVGSTYCYVLKKFYEKTNLVEYLQKIIEIDAANFWAKEHLLEHYLPQWKNDFKRQIFTSFNKKIQQETWILEEFKPKVRVFLENNIDEFLNQNQNDVAITLLGIYIKIFPDEESKLFFDRRYEKAKQNNEIAELKKQVSSAEKKANLSRKIAVGLAALNILITFGIAIFNNKTTSDKIYEVKKEFSQPKPVDSVDNMKVLLQKIETLQLNEQQQNEEIQNLKTNLEQFSRQHRYKYFRYSKDSIKK